MHSYHNMAECQPSLEKKKPIPPLSTHTPGILFATHSLSNYHGSQGVSASFGHMVAHWKLILRSREVWPKKGLDYGYGCGSEAFCLGGGESKVKIWVGVCTSCRGIDWAGWEHDCVAIRPSFLVAVDVRHVRCFWYLGLCFFWIFHIHTKVQWPLAWHKKKHKIESACNSYAEKEGRDNESIGCKGVGWKGYTVVFSLSFVSGLWLPTLTLSKRGTPTRDCEKSPSFVCFLFSSHSPFPKAAFSHAHLGVL